MPEKRARSLKRTSAASGAGKPTGAVTVRLNEEEQTIVKDLAEAMGCSQGELFRRCLPAVRQQTLLALAGDNTVIEMLGDKQTLEAKQKIVKRLRWLDPEAIACSKAGVLRRTFAIWLQADAVFRMLCEEAQAIGIGMAERWLVREARAGKIAAIFGLLNAKHPDYGVIRRQLIDRVLSPFVQKVLDVAAEFLSSDALDTFSERIGREADRLAASIAASAKKQ